MYSRPGDPKPEQKGDQVVVYHPCDQKPDGGAYNDKRQHADKYLIDHLYIFLTLDKVDTYKNHPKQHERESKEQGRGAASDGPQYPRKRSVLCCEA